MAKAPSMGPVRRTPGRRYVWRTRRRVRGRRTAGRQRSRESAPPRPAAGYVQLVNELMGLGVAQHLHLVAGQLLEGEAERDVGLAVEGAELATGGDLDHRPARVPDRDALEVLRAVIRAFGARRAADWLPGRARRNRCIRRGCAALGISPPRGLAPALRRLLRVVEEGAGAAIGHAVEGGRSALGAEPGGPALGIPAASPRATLRLAGFAGGGCSWQP